MACQSPRNNVKEEMHELLESEESSFVREQQQNAQLAIGIMNNNEENDVDDEEVHQESPPAEDNQEDIFPRGFISHERPDNGNQIDESIMEDQQLSSASNGLEPPSLTDVFRQLTGEDEKPDQSQPPIFPGFSTLNNDKNGAPTMVSSSGGLVPPHRAVSLFNEKLIQCSRCNFATCSAVNMERHMETCPKIHPKFRGTEGRLQCDKCDYTTQRAFNLRRHIVSRNCAGRRVDMPVESNETPEEHYRRVRRWPNGYQAKRGERSQLEREMKMAGLAEQGISMDSHGEALGQDAAKFFQELIRNPTNFNHHQPQPKISFDSLNKSGNYWPSPDLSEKIDINERTSTAEFTPINNNQNRLSAESVPIFSEKQEGADRVHSVMTSSDVNGAGGSGSVVSIMPSSSCAPSTCDGRLEENFWPQNVGHHRSLKPGVAQMRRHNRLHYGMKYPRRIHGAGYTSTSQREANGLYKIPSNSSGNMNSAPGKFARFALQDVVWQRAKEVFGTEEETLQGLLETIACRLNERSFVQLNFDSCRSLKMLQRWILEDYEERGKRA